MPKRVKQKAAEESGGSWAMSYGDMMTLLLTFFILIVSFSTTELIKFRKAMGSLRGAMGVLFEQDGAAIYESQTTMMREPQLDQELMINALDDIEQQAFTMNEVGTGLEIEIDNEGLTFRLHDELMFNLGDTELRPEIKNMLDKIGTLISRFSCDVRIEGHTDNIPVSTSKYPSNWELSALRAIQVLRYFEQVVGIQSERLIAVGFGQTRPMVPNDTPENRRRNRRVEIYLAWKPLKPSISY